VHPVHHAGEEGGQGRQHPDSAAGFGDGAAREPCSPAWQPQQSSPVLLKADQPCFLLLLRLLEGKIRFAFCSASLTESLSSAAGRKAEPTYGACIWVLAQLRGTLRAAPSPLSAGADSSCWGRGTASPRQRHQPPSAATPLPCLWWRKPYF